MEELISFGKLVKLNLTGLSKITSVSSFIAKSRLTLFFQHNQDCFKFLPHSLIILNAPNISITSSEHLQDLPRNLQHLNIFNNVTNLALYQVLNWRNIGQKFRINPNQASNITTDSIKLLPQNLQSLAISSFLLTDDAIEYLPRSLIRLRIVGSVSDASLKYLPQNLIYLWLSSSKMTSGDVALSQFLQEIKILQVYDPFSFGSSHSNITSTAWEPLPELVFENL